jgi:hypothetical protein
MTLSIKAEALKEYLEDGNVDEGTITEIIEEYDDESYFYADGEELLILDDEEADEKAAELIGQSMWAFNADFIAHQVDHNKIEDFGELVKSIRSIQDQCEGANSAIMAMIEDFGDFVADAISADGRGHFISPLDGEEREFTINRKSADGETPKYDKNYHIYIYRV